MHAHTPTHKFVINTQQTQSHTHALCVHTQTALKHNIQIEISTQ